MSGRATMTNEERLAEAARILANGGRLVVAKNVRLPEVERGAAAGALPFGIRVEVCNWLPDDTVIAIAPPTDLLTTPIDLRDPSRSPPAGITADATTTPADEARTRNPSISSANRDLPRPEAPPSPLVPAPRSTNGDDR